DVCDELGLAFLAWSPLGGLGDAKSLADKHPTFAEVATARGVSAQQVALAGERAQAPVGGPIPGAQRAPYITAPAHAAGLDPRPRRRGRPRPPRRRDRPPRPRLTAPGALLPVPGGEPGAPAGAPSAASSTPVSGAGTAAGGSDSTSQAP